MPAKSDKWTDERLATAKRMWCVEGASASDIAAELGMGLTREAVSGMIFRKKWVRSEAINERNRTKLVRSKRKAKVRPAPKPVVPPAPPRPAPSHAATDQARVRPIDLKPGQCKWPVGDPRSEAFGFCGEPRDEVRAEGSCPYCPQHANRAYKTRDQVRAESAAYYASLHRAS